MTLLKKCQHKYGKVEEDYQYCENCGIAIAAPKIVCTEHRWLIIDVKGLTRTNYINGSSYPFTVYTQECENCGEIKTTTNDHREKSNTTV